MPTPTDPNQPQLPNPNQYMTPDQFNAWIQLQQQQAQAQAEMARNALRQQYGPELQYAPVKESFVDAQGNPVEKGTPGAIQKVALRDEYKLSSPDAQIAALQQQQQVGEQQSLDKTMKAASQAKASASSGAAMRGGLNRSSKALLQRQNMQDLMNARQSVTQQGAQDRAGIAAKGEELKRGTEAYNLENLLKGGEYTNKFELEKYKQQMASKAATETANATREQANNQGKK